jgi:hypothetical protein
MRKAFLIIVFFFISCQREKSVDSNEVLKYSDSVIRKSKLIQDSAFKTFKVADEITKKKVVQMVNKVNKVNEELNSLKLAMKLTQAKEIIKEVVKEVLVHDTIYITEKKNFWGKAKIKIDSSKSTTEVVDSSFNEKEN